MGQIIGMWAIIGLFLFINGNTKILFKTEWAYILAHGPLVWFVWLGYIIFRTHGEDK
jgi:hypothetical protein